MFSKNMTVGSNPTQSTINMKGSDMSFFEYIRARKLAKYHSEGRSPWPKNIQNEYAYRLTAKYKRIEEEYPEYINMYDEYEKH